MNVRLSALWLLLTACGATNSASTAPTTAHLSAPASAVSTAPKAPVALEEYYKIRRMPAFSRSGLPMVSFSHDERLVAYASDEGGRIDVWVKPIGAASGTPLQVTHSEGFVHSLSFSPSEDLLVYEADRGGDELPRLYATDSLGSQAHELVPEMPQGRRTQFVEWASDGKTFLYLSSARNDKALDLVEYDVKTKKSTILWQASGKLSFATASRDHKKFILGETHSEANSDLYLLERYAAAPVLLTKHEGDISFEAKSFSKDAKSLHITSDENGEFTELFAIDLASKTRKLVHKDAWDVEDAGLSKTYRYFVTATNEDGLNKAALFDLTSNKDVVLPSPKGKGAWVPLEFSKSDRYLGVTLTGDEAPSSIYVMDMVAKSATPLANVLPKSLIGHSMVAGESVRIPSFDGKSVPAFLYRPAGVGPFPAIIDVHGGPTSQSRRSFAPSRQYFVSKGYAVLVPNVRGSTGYGKSYSKLDNMDLGGGPLQDVVACKHWLVKNANVASDKVVVMGGSYGGYMALVAEAFTPDEFVANVDFFGVSDLKTLVESFPPYWASASAFIFKKFGDPKNPSHAKYQHDRSPAHFVANMKRPLLVVQGDKDARVKKDQSDRIVAELKQRNVPVHYLVLENEGHGFTKTENNLKAYKLTDRFLDRYVFGDTSVTDLP